LCVDDFICYRENVARYLKYLAMSLILSWQPACCCEIHTTPMYISLS
jgi:hypothetical protein